MIGGGEDDAGSALRGRPDPASDRLLGLLRAGSVVGVAAIDAVHVGGGVAAAGIGGLVAADLVAAALGAAVAGDVVGRRARPGGVVQAGGVLLEAVVLFALETGVGRNAAGAYGGVFGVTHGAGGIVVDVGVGHVHAGMGVQPPAAVIGDDAVLDREAGQGVSVDARVGVVNDRAVGQQRGSPRCADAAGISRHQAIGDLGGS